MLFRFRYQMLRFRHSSVQRGNYVFRAGAGDVGTDVFGSRPGGRCVSESSQQWGSASFGGLISAVRAVVA